MQAIVEDLSAIWSLWMFKYAFFGECYLNNTNNTNNITRTNISEINNKSCRNNNNNNNNNFGNNCTSTNVFPPTQIIQIMLVHIMQHWKEFAKRRRSSSSSASFQKKCNVQ